MTTARNPRRSAAWRANGGESRLGPPAAGEVVARARMEHDDDAGVARVAEQAVDLGAARRIGPRARPGTYGPGAHARRLDEIAERARGVRVAPERHAHVQEAVPRAGTRSRSRCAAGTPAARASSAPAEENCSKSTESVGRDAPQPPHARRRDRAQAPRHRSGATAPSRRPGPPPAARLAARVTIVRRRPRPARAEVPHDGSEQRPVAEPPELDHDDAVHVLERRRARGRSPRRASAAAKPRASTPPATRSRHLARDEVHARPAPCATRERGRRGARGPAGAGRGSSRCGSSTGTPCTPRGGRARAGRRRSARAARAESARRTLALHQREAGKDVAVAVHHDGGPRRVAPQRRGLAAERAREEVEVGRAVVEDAPALESRERLATPRATRSAST